MQYKRIKVDCNKEYTDLLIGILIDFDFLSYEVIDSLPVDNPYDMDYEELKPDLEDLGDRESVIFYVENDFDESLVIEEIKRQIKDCDISVSLQDESEWRDTWKDYFHPIKVGDILIKPSWENLSLEESRNKTIIEIDPGISFGTGTHETTKMCIEAISHYEGICEDVSKLNFLDLGCGSGILSVVAHKKGFRNITCVDIDPDCIITTKENLTKNNIDYNNEKFGCFSFLTGDLTRDKELLNQISDEGIDIVCGNILADIIALMIPVIKSKLSHKGLFISSGIIEGKEEKLRLVFEDNGFEILEIKKDGEWFMIIGQNG